MTIKFAIEGAGAIEATTELFTLPGIEGEWKAEKTQEPVIVTIGVIVGIVAGTMDIAEHIRQWYQEYRKGKNGAKIDKVELLGRNGNRIVLENATIEDIKRFLDS